MFKHHHHHGHHRGWAHAFGRHFDRHEGGFGGGRGRGGGRMGRFFDHGDLRLVVLKLIADQPRHGYEIIKAVEAAAGGAYSPSPGVIYPTLTLLEEMGQATAQADGAKKLYAITPDGQAFLAANDAAVKAIFQRMDHAAARSAAFSPQVMRARENLKTALKFKLTGEGLSPDQIAAVAAILDDAAKAVEAV